MATNSAQLAFAVRAINEASKTLKDIDQDITGLSGTATKSSGPLSGLGSSLKTVAGIASGFVIGAGLTNLPGLLSGMTGKASDLNEAVSKVGVVFGPAARDIEKFAQDSAKNMGISETAALSAAGTFGNLFTALGMAQQPAADMSRSIVTLAGDLASFNNIGTDEALEKLRAGLLGEVEPLRALGVSFNAADVEARAFKLGLADANGEISEGAKVQARYSLIMEQTAAAQGDFARTADGLANKQRIMAAEFENLQAEIGQELLPVMLALGDFTLNTLIPTLRDIAEVVRDDVAPSFRSGLDALKPVFEFVLDHEPLLVAAIAAIGVAILVALGPGAAAVLGILALITLLGLVRDNWVEIKAKVEEFVGSVPGLETALGIAGDAVQDVITLVENLVTAVETTIALISALASGDWNEAWTLFKDLALQAVGLVVDFMKLGFADDIATALFDNRGKLFNAGVDLLTALWEGIKKYWDDALYFYFIGFPLLVVNTIGSLASTMAPLGVQLLSGFKDAASTFFFTQVVPFFSSIPGHIMSGFKGAWNAVADSINGAIPDSVGFSSGGIKIAGETVVPGFNVSIPLPNPIPRLAEGGIVTRPTFALIGEAGPEAVVPLGRGGGGGLGATFSVTIYALDGDSVRRVVPEIARELNAYLRGSGQMGLVT